MSPAPSIVAMCQEGSESNYDSLTLVESQDDHEAKRGEANAIDEEIADDRVTSASRNP